MSEDIRFHLDEHIDPDIARALRQHGIDVTTTVEAGLRSSSDLEQLNFARQEQRVFVTHDVDFLRLASESSDHSGIVFCRISGSPIGEIIRMLILLYEILQPEEMNGQVEYL